MDVVDHPRHHPPPHPAAPLLPHDQPGLGEDLGVVAHRRLSLLQGLDEVARADLAGRRDQAQEAQAHRVGERGKGARQALRFGRSERSGHERRAALPLMH